MNNSHTVWVQMNTPSGFDPNTGGFAVNRSATLARLTFPAMLGLAAAGGGGKGTAAARWAAWCSLAQSCTALLTVSVTLP